MMSKNDVSYMFFWGQTPKKSKRFLLERICDFRRVRPHRRIEELSGELFGEKVTIGIPDGKGGFVNKSVSKKLEQGEQTVRVLKKTYVKRLKYNLIMCSNKC